MSFEFSDIGFVILVTESYQTESIITGLVEAIKIEAAKVTLKQKEGKSTSSRINRTTF